MYCTTTSFEQISVSDTLRLMLYSTQLNYTCNGLIPVPSQWDCALNCYLRSKNRAILCLKLLYMEYVCSSAGGKHRFVDQDHCLISSVLYNLQFRHPNYVRIMLLCNRTCWNTCFGNSYNTLCILQTYVSDGIFIFIITRWLSHVIIYQLHLIGSMESLDFTS